MKEALPEDEKARETGLVLVLLVMLFAWFDPRSFWPPLGILLLLACILVPRLFLPLVRPWFWLGHRLGAATTPLILTMLYFAVVTPVGLLRRLAGADPMQRRQWRQGHGSVMRQRDHLFKAEDLDKPY